MSNELAIREATDSEAAALNLGAIDESEAIAYRLGAIDGFARGFEAGYLHAQRFFMELYGIPQQ